MILLVNPPAGTWGQDIYYPSGLFSLLAVLREKELESDVLDLEYLTRSGEIRLDQECFFDEAAERILDREPTVVGFGTIVTNYHIVVHLTRVLREKRPSLRIIYGGPQASSLARPTLEKFPGLVDAVVVGEGEQTLLRLLECDFRSDEMKSIGGLAFSEGDQVIETGPPPLIEDLDTLPLEFLSPSIIGNYRELCRRETMNPFSYSIEVGRGCPYRCSYCATAGMWLRKDRRKSARRVLSEMERAGQYGFTAFALTHDNFTASKSRFREFCGYLKEKGSPYCWTASSRGDVLGEEELSLLAEAGCCGLFFGVESGSTHMQAVFQKKLNIEKTLNTIQRCGELGISSNSMFILGHPEETEDDVNDSIRMALRVATIPLAGSSLVKLCPLPGSTDYERYGNLIFFSGNTPDMARRPFIFRATEALIEDNPEIFPFFRAFPCKYLDDDGLTVLLEFYEVMRDRYPRLLVKVLEAEHLAPLQLFSRWLKWKEAFYASHAINREWIRQTFASFFRQVFVRREGPQLLDISLHQNLIS